MMGAFEPVPEPIPLHCWSDGVAAAERVYREKPLIRPQANS